MARDGSGNYSIPNTFTAGTVIASAAVNANFSDIATALTGSLARNSEGPMTAVLQLHANGFVYEVDPDTGMKRIGANEQAIFCGGANIITITTSTVSVAAALNLSGALVSGGAGTFSGAGTFGGTITASGSSAGFVGSELISTEAGADAGPIVSLYRDSASPAASDFIGAAIFYGKDSGGNKTAYGQYDFQITDPTNGSEDADWFVRTIIGGTLTAIIRSSAAQIQIPGTLAVTGAVTGASINVGTGAATAGAVAGDQLATQTEQETGTATNKIVAPGTQHFHPVSLKTWAQITGTGVIQVNASYNLTSTTDNGPGDYTYTIATDFSSAEWGFEIGTFGSAIRTAVSLVSAPTAGAIRIGACDSTNGTAQDQNRQSFCGQGDL